MEKPSSDELLKSVKEMLKQEGYEPGENEDNREVIRNYILPALESNKDVQKLLYYEFYKPAPSPLSRLKAFVINKIGNVSRNTVERSIIRQQKYNNNVAFLLRFLLEENTRLSKEIEDLKQNNE